MVKKIKIYQCPCGLYYRRPSDALKCERKHAEEKMSHKDLFYF